MIILKNEIKEVFKAHGMPEGLTVTRGNKFISISGQCGEPVLTITKVEVGSKLTKAERAIIIGGYIEPALTANKKAILAYIKLRKDTTVQDALDTFVKGNTGLSSSRYYKDNQKYGYVSLTNGDNNCTVYMSTAGEFDVSFSRLSKDYYKEIARNMIKKAEKILPLYLETLKAVDERNKTLQTAKSFLNEKCGF